MTNRFQRILAAVLTGGLMLAAPTLSSAAQGDCGQPNSSGTKPSASDALAILKEAVGQDTACDAEPCICDINSSGSTTAADALLALKVAVGQDVEFACDCDTGPTDPACTSAEFFSRAGSDLDSGWTGLAHNSEIIEGAAISFRTLRRCTDNQAPCSKNSDCTNNTCKATCDCNDDVECEVTGPTHDKHCLTTLAACTDNTDCAAGVACVHTFGPPLPLSSGGTPVCVLSYFTSDITGTANSETGEAVTSVSLRSRVFLGITLDQPCPRCGPPEEEPAIGDEFTCEGGQTPGAACTVEGVSPDFGGVSHSCAPALSASISGTGLAIRFQEVTTGTVTKTAQLPCSDFSFQSHPSRGNGKCIDNNAACTTNGDCLRCSGDATTTCTTNAECTGKGSCAAAPDQPVTCGYWCHCGFCNNDPSLPCFENGDCTDGKTCVVGTGGSSAQNAPQKKPNDCSGDKFVCGVEDEERCANTTTGSCSLQPYRNCQDDSVCQSFGAGTCVIEPRPCFESRITRTGEPSPLGKYCEFESKSCNTNADCTGPGDSCVDDASNPETVALFCVPGTSSGAVNSAGGITGPGAIRLNSFLKICRCGDLDIGCDEQCDDGNTVNGDGCDDLCQDE